MTQKEFDEQSNCDRCKVMLTDEQLRSYWRSNRPNWKMPAKCQACLQVEYDERKSNLNVLHS